MGIFISMETKICTKCGEEKSVKEFYYHRQRKYYMETCKVCNKQQSTAYGKRIKVENNLVYQLRNRAAELKRRAKSKGLPYEEKMFNVLKELYDEQKGLCYYTKLPMKTNGFEFDDPYCFVVDKKDPTLGYVKDNMVFCCNCINRIKSSYTIDQVKQWVALL